MWRKSKSKSSRIIMRIFISGLVLFAAVQVQAAKVHTGEDGTEYILDNASVNPGSQARANWLLGKVEPILAEQSAQQDELKVIVYISRSGKAPDISQVARDAKASHARAINELSEQIRTIERKYRPSWSMSEFEEKQHMEVVELAMDEADLAQLRSLREELDKSMDAMRKDVGAAIEQAVAADQQTVADFITNSGGSITSRITLTNAIGATIPSSLLTPLAEHPLVHTVMNDRPVEYELDVSVPSVGYDAWWNDVPAIEGYPFDFGVVDGGVVQNHPAFGCVNTFYSRAGSSIATSHGTHVTGIVVSCDGTYQGGVQDIDAVIWTNSGFQSTTMDNMDWMATSALQGPEVVNHSLGYGVANDVDYNANDSFYDAYIENFNIMVTKSAGNGGWTTTNPGDPAITITHPAPAYNLMAVANMNDQGSPTRTDDVRSGSSSVGPTVSGRRKPDIAAPGNLIMSTNSEWNGSTGAFLNCGSAATIGDDFINCSGTSMAAPHVAAAIVLMEDGGNNTPMAQKAVLINTADAWDSNNTQTTTDDGPVTGSLWDKSYGWGYLDMWEANFNRGDYFIGSVIPRNDNATPNDYKLYKGLMFADEKATLVWQKRAGTYVAGAASDGQRTLSDLNIRLYDESSGLLVDSDLDGNDNVHQVASDVYRDTVIKVYSWSTIFDGATSESYALATEENFVTANPPSFSRNYSRPNWVGPFQTFDVIVRIFNNGDVGAHNSTLTLTNITGVSGGGVASLATIASGGGVQETTYNLSTSGLVAGTHWLPLDVSSISYDETYTYSTVSGVSLIVETTPPTSSCTASTYNNGSPIPVGWTAVDTQTGVQNTYLYAKAPGGVSFVYTGLFSAGTNGSFDYSPSADGLYEFAVRSVDIGNNWEAYPIISECQIILDTVIPTSTLSTPTYDNGGSIPLNFTVSDPSPSSGLSFVDFWYKKEVGGVWTYTGLFSTSFSGTLNFTPPAGDGVYYFHSRAKDNAQNIEPNAIGNGKDRTVYDTTAPTGSILINGGAAGTTSLIVTLNLTASDATSGVSRMRFSNNNTIWSPWEAYATTRAGWDLSSFGGNPNPEEKPVYVQYADKAGNISATVKDVIEFGKDTDGDGIIDNLDNCTLVPNPAQRDTNGDGYGNFCDPDLNNDLIVNIIDKLMMRNLIGSSDPDADLNGDGTVNIIDKIMMRNMVGQPPGPSGVAP